MPLTSLSLSSFLLNTADLLEALRDLSIIAENDVVDARGAADRYELGQAVKQTQTLQIVTHLPPSVAGDPKASNLHVSVWSIGGTDYLADLRSGKLSVSNNGKEGSGLASAYRFPVGTSTGLELSTDVMVVSAANFTGNLLTGTAVAFKATVSIQFAGETVTAPMLFKSSKHTVNRGEIQMEDVVATLQGLPTAPSDSSILSAAILGTALTSFSVNTGANTYATGTGQKCLIDKLELAFDDAALLTQSLTLAVQGGMAVTAP